MTKANIRDGMAAAVLVMGEADEQTPLAVIEHVPFVAFHLSGARPNGGGTRCPAHPSGERSLRAAAGAGALAAREAKELLSFYAYVHAHAISESWSRCMR